MICYSFPECLSYYAERERERDLETQHFLVPFRDYKLITEVSAVSCFDVPH